MIENRITQRILKCAFKVHTKLGPGLLESAYQECLYYELMREGLNVVKEKPMPLIYDEVKLDTGYRIDLFVNGKVVIEVKAVEGITEVHLAQILTYLKLSNCKIGLLLNFNVKSMKHGVKRIINTKKETLRNSVQNSHNSVVK